MAKKAEKASAEPELVSIVYVGKKPFAADNVAHSRKVWNGPGDVQQVTPAQAKRLLLYPDQWAKQGEEPADEADTAARIDAIHIDRSGKSVGAAELDLMSPAELVEYASHFLGVDLDQALPKDELVAVIRDREMNNRLDGDFERNQALTAQGEQAKTGSQQAS